MSSTIKHRRVRVLLPLSIGDVYDYRAPASLNVDVGHFVTVPLGHREVTGVVWEEATDSSLAEDRMKDIQAVLPVAMLPAESRDFIDWVAQYTMQRRGRVLKMAISVPEAFYPKAPRTGYRFTGEQPGKMTAARKRVLEIAAEGGTQTASDLAAIAGVSTSVVKGLADKGALEAVDLPAERPIIPANWQYAAFELSEGQTLAADALISEVEKNAFAVSLLDGVTGSGKTEVYFEAIAACLKAGRQALVLLPEIALTAQWLARFEERFGARPVEWHSDLGQSERRRNWRAVIEGRADIVVGARSALFLPFKMLGLIVVDEEHEASYKQDEGVPYNARDMAVVRAKIGDFPVVLASATPSLESLMNAQTGKYSHLKLASRYGGAALPDVEVVDLKQHPPGSQRWISEPLRLAAEDTLAQGQQVMLFLNRRGYAPLTLCDTCGHRLQCPNCSAWLVEHRLTNRLQCHHCGYTTTLPKSCSECGAEGSFKACGPGIERLSEEAESLFPGRKIAMMASDTVSSPRAAAEFVGAMERGEIEILIGTQMVAKGYHFPNLTLVGIIDADLGLAGGDLRAAERTYQLLSQVTGRAGRESLLGKVYLQSYLPEHPVIEAIVHQQSSDFFALEAAGRENAGMPPYGRLAALILSGVKAESVAAFAHDLARRAPMGEKITVLGPAPAPLSMIRGRHRYRFLVKCDKDINIQSVIGKWLQGRKVPNDIRLQIDIDPYNFM
ncbi:primosomal protein N' [uncultured Sneathiella sp.]|jgi:primosomal protein N' (replication factor Y)|uniref:primosomal protein N' n=1 Tax=uncultured Sneathiella sp. TaxID=879315 RepID=UPI0030D81583|tara:strand:- start:8360 stop:10540 length:2181 start_codon:yes stop_codon:yes gene_type:complete